MDAEGLEAFVRCSVAGCQWRIQLKSWMATTRCYQHLGPAVPQYEMSSDGIETLRVRFMPREYDPDYNPDTAA